jgi:hypothetical protein
MSPIAYVRGVPAPMVPFLLGVRGAKMGSSPQPPASARIKAVTAWLTIVARYRFVLA